MSLLTCARVCARVALPAVVAATMGGGLAGAAEERIPGPDAPAVADTDSSARRAVRGAPVDEAGVNETPELRDLRWFEEQAFPRFGWPTQSAPRGDAGAGAPRLPGRWSGTGDIPAELRSPETTQRSPGPPATAPDSEWLRGLRVPEIPIRWDPYVLRYLDYFKSDTKGRAIMSTWLRRAGRYRQLFERTLERLGLPKDLVYVAMVESGFEAAAKSRAGAGGIWQFMPGAAKVYGLEVGYWVDMRRDPEKAAEAAGRYLKDLYVRFGSWPLVLAAYNAGYGAVLKSIQRYNTNDYWELCRIEAGLPWESSIYVPKILAAAIVGHNLEAFGFADVTPDPPFAYDLVEAPPGTPLAAIARATGSKPEVIAALNPQLVRDRTPADRGPTGVRIPQGTAEQYAQALDKTRAATERVETLVLRFGETLDDVAKARGLSTRELRKLNGVRDTAEVRAGVTILVPKRGPAPSDVAAEEAEDTFLVAVPERSFSYEGRERVFYRTRDGDVLDEVADTFGVTTAELVEWNTIDPSAKLHPKMILQIFVRKDFDPAGVVLLDPARVHVVTLGSEEFLELEAARRGKKRLAYTARAGDTLAKAGRRYGLTPGDLARINRFSYNTELREGQTIIVYSPVGEPTHDVTKGLTPEPKRPHEAPPRPSAGKSTGGKVGKASGKTAIAEKGSGSTKAAAKQ